MQIGYWRPVIATRFSPEGRVKVLRVGGSMTSDRACDPSSRAPNTRSNSHGQSSCWPRSGRLLMESVYSSLPIPLLPWYTHLTFVNRASPLTLTRTGDHYPCGWGRWLCPHPFCSFHRRGSASFCIFNLNSG